MRPCGLCPRAPVDPADAIWCGEAMQRVAVIGLVIDVGFAAAGLAAPTPAARAPRYLAMFDDLVRRIERDHTFPPGYVRDVGHAWRDDVPRLREEFSRATDRDQALIALRHLPRADAI